MTYFDSFETTINLLGQKLANFILQSNVQIPEMSKNIIGYYLVGRIAIKQKDLELNFYGDSEDYQNDLFDGIMNSIEKNLFSSIEYKSVLFEDQTGETHLVNIETINKYQIILSDKLIDSNHLITDSFPTFKLYENDEAIYCA